MKKSLIIASVFAATAFTASIFVSAEEGESTEKPLATENVVVLEEAVETAAVETNTVEGVVPESIEASFQSMDANQDGVISIEEAEMNDMLLDAFIDLDLDKTADLSKEEYSKFAALTK